MRVSVRENEREKKQERRENEKRKREREIIKRDKRETNLSHAVT